MRIEAAQRITRYEAMALVLAAVGAWPMTAYAQGQSFPSKPIRIVVPFSPGSQTDMLARMIGQKLAERWGQQVVVDNRPSAGGTIAAGMVASATPDGHTLLVHSAGHAVNATLYSKLPFDTLRDFAGVSQIASVPNVIIVPPTLGVKTLKELIALAKQKPGQLNFGSAGIGSGAHINAEQFALAAGITVNHIPYKGAPEAITDTMAGRIHYFFAPLVPIVPLVKDGRLVAVGVSTAQRSPVLPDVPTIAEAALPGFEFDSWFGMMAPGKTPKAIVEQISAEVRRILDSPDIKQRMLSQGAIPKPRTPADFDAFIRAEVDKLGQIVKASGARAD